ncbi:MAG TPA: hypothetical protein VGB06_00010 [Solirubrobacterales bacterium]
MKRFTALLTATMIFAAIHATAASAAEFEKFGIASASAELSTDKAGAHPDFTTNIEFNTNPSSESDSRGLKKPYANVKSIKVILPPGLLGNLNAVDTCSTVTFATALVTEDAGCPLSSQVGIAVLQLWSFENAFTVSIYNLETSGADSVARLGFYVTAVPAFIDARVRSDGDYGVTAEVTGISSLVPLHSAKTTLWGVPAASSHDTERLTIQESADSKSASPARSSGRAPEPFMTNPTSCGVPLEVGFEVDSYQRPGTFDEKPAPLVDEITDCGRLGFDPSLSLTPTTREAAAPSGADATLTIPQNEAVNGRATSHLRDTVITLPEGLTIAPGAADGLAACSEAQVGFKVSPPPPARCPEAAKIATGEIDSPALSRPIQAAIYQRTPEPGRLTRGWLVADELGVHVKLPGEFQLNPRTGQITSLFLDTPQVPVREFKLHFKGGARGVLATPRTCGAYETAFEFTPWSGGAAKEGQTPMSFDQGCATGGFSPKLSAGTVNPAAGAFSPVAVTLTRQSGEENVAGLDVRTPPGLLAKLAGVPLCAAAAAATAGCPAASQVGTATVASGPGPSPLWIPQPDKDPTAVYLGGPYKGGPYSLVVKVPAQAGPFDLGVVVTRAALHVDKETAEVSVASDPLPQILEGIPISYRTIHVDVNRPEFTLNPTSCARMQTVGRAVSEAGTVAGLSSPFQVGSCASLPYKPKLRMRLFGKTNRGAHPRFRAIFSARKGHANTAKVSVALPRSAFLDQAHIRSICTRVQFRADQCPAGSIYGQVRALTPLLDEPLKGPVYLRSSNNLLPDLVATLHGPNGLEIDLVGRIDSIGGGIRTTFAAVPDAPVSKVVLTMQGGKKGLLVNSRNLCEEPSFADVKLDGQNGKTADQRPRVKNSCRKARR